MAWWLYVWKNSRAIPLNVKTEKTVQCHIFIHLKQPIYDIVIEQIYKYNQNMNGRSPRIVLANKRRILLLEIHVFRFRRISERQIDG